DANNDGVLNGRELDAMMPAMRQTLDPRNSGTITKQDFIVGIKIQAAMRSDRNGDGYLSGGEIPADLVKYAYRTDDGRMVVTAETLRTAFNREYVAGPTPPRPTPTPG